MNKYCPKCKTLKQKTRFYKSSSSKDGLQSYCKTCKKAYSKTPRQKEVNHEWYENNKDDEGYKERTKKADRKYKRQNREILNKKNSAYSKSEMGKVANRRYRVSEKGKETRAIVNARYYKTEKGIAYRKNNARKRRARITKAKGSFTTDEFKSLCQKYDNRCLCCGNFTKLTVDHVIPLSKGGSNYITNIQPLCLSCNSSKRDKHIDYRQLHTARSGNISRERFGQCSTAVVRSAVV